MTLRDKRQRTFKFSATSEAQLAHICHATGSGATAVLEQALAHYYRDLFGPGALYLFATPDRAPQEDHTENCPPET